MFNDKFCFNQSNLIYVESNWVRSVQSRVWPREEGCGVSAAALHALTHAHKPSFSFVGEVDVFKIRLRCFYKNAKLYVILIVYI